MEEEFDTDQALSSLGRLGKWQLVEYIYIAVILTTSACFAMLEVVFIGKFPTTLKGYHWRIQRIPLPPRLF